MSPISASNCLSPDAIVAMLEGTSTLDRDRLSEHLDSCTACRSLMVALVRSGSKSCLSTDDRSEYFGVAVAKPGTQVDRYQITNIAGIGGMGIVYKAHDPLLSRTVALKLMRPELAEEASMKELLVSESRAMANISHRNVVAVHDVGEWNGQVFVAMEWVNGITLAKWLRQSQRTWKQILDAFHQAGMGVAAAHNASIVHRDFKADNVLISDNNIVRVTDFGLAFRTAGFESDDPLNNATFSRPDTCAVGTPAYMAPEQLADEKVDGRADQFSFCVALYEALYGKRPNQGKVSTKRGIPRRIRQALERGLRLKPSDRFPTMNELLQAMDPTISKTQGVGVLIGLLGIAGSVAAFLANGDVSARERCQSSQSRLAQVWGEEERSELREVMLAPGAGQAEARWEQVERGMNKFADRWRAAQHDICVLSESGPQSSELFDLRTDCQHGQIDRIGHLIGLLHNSDVSVQRSGVGAIAAMAATDSCSAAAVWQARMPNPSNPETRLEVERIRAELIRAKEYGDALQFSEAMALLRAMHLSAERLDFAPVTAEVLLELGEMQINIGDGHTSAMETLRNAADTATACAHDKIAAQAWTTLMFLPTTRERHLAKALEYAGHARAAIDRLGAPPALKAKYLLYRGLLHSTNNEPEQALAQIQSARALYAELQDPINELVALGHISGVLLEQRKFPEALIAINEELRGLMRVHGENHPDIAISLLNFALALTGTRDVEAGLEYELRALNILRSNFGDDHTVVVTAHFNITLRLQELHRPDEALVYLDQISLEGKTPVGKSELLSVRGGVLLDLGRTKESADVLEQAEMLARHIPNSQGSGALSIALVGQGKMLQALGREGQALSKYLEAIEIFENGPVVDKYYQVYPRIGAGDALTALGKPKQALETLEVALLLETAENENLDAGTMGKIEFSMANANWALGRRKLAIEFASTARVNLSTDPVVNKDSLKDVEHWLASNTAKKI